jgi:hypothetical protein
MDDFEGLDVAAIQAALRDDFKIVRAYGKAHPETWVGMRFDIEPAVRVVAVFASELTVHDRQLRHLVAHPGCLVLESCPYTHADLQAMRAEIDELTAQRAADTGRRVISSIGEGVGLIHVRLRADQADFAAQLAQRFGSVVELQVGEFSFPDRRRPHPPGRPQPLQRADIDGLGLRLEVDRAAIRAGDDGHGQLVFHNGSDRRIGPLSGGQPVVGVLVDDSGQRVGGYSVRVAGTGWTVDLDAREASAVGVLFGTASLREELGYVVSPGEYFLHVEFPFGYEHVGPPTHVLTAPPARVIVTARDA